MTYTNISALKQETRNSPEMIKDLFANTRLDALFDAVYKDGGRALDLTAGYLDRLNGNYGKQLIKETFSVRDALNVVSEQLQNPRWTAEDDINRFILPVLFQTVVLPIYFGKFMDRRRTNL